MGLILAFLFCSFGLHVWSWDMAIGFIYLNFVIILISSRNKPISLIFLSLVISINFLIWSLEVPWLFGNKGKKYVSLLFGSCENYNWTQRKSLSLLFKPFCQTEHNLYLHLCQLLFWGGEVQQTPFPYGSCAFLVKHITSYFFILLLLQMGTSFFYSLPLNGFCFIHVNAIDFCILLSEPVTALQFHLFVWLFNGFCGGFWC